MNNSCLYHKWHGWVMQWIPDDCATRLQNLVLLMVGIYLEQSVHLTKVARKLPIRAQKLSLAKRLSRFLDNEAVDVVAWYAPWSSWLIESASSGGNLYLVLDTTKVTSSHRMLCIGIAWRGRTLPLAWNWIAHGRGHGKVQGQIDLLNQIYPLIDANVAVSVVGDGEFGKVLLMERLKFWGWHYSMRQRKDTKVLLAGLTRWCRLDEITIEQGQVRVYRDVSLTHSALSTHLVIIWHKGEKEPLYLATSYDSVRACWRDYRRRMWIEEMFGDMKGHGFDLEASRLGKATRLNRLMLAVSLIYVWLMSVGEHVLQQGFQAEVDRKNRRDLSLFRLGWDWIERRLALFDPLPDCLCPNFCSVSGS